MVRRLLQACAASRNLGSSCHHTLGGMSKWSTSSRVPSFVERALAGASPGIRLDKDHVGAGRGDPLEIPGDDEPGARFDPMRLPERGPLLIDDRREHRRSGQLCQQQVRPAAPDEAGHSDVRIREEPLARYMRLRPLTGGHAPVAGRAQFPGAYAIVK